MVFNFLSTTLAFAAILFGVSVESLTTHEHGICAYYKDAWNHGIPLNVCHTQYGGAPESSTSYKFVCSSPDQKHVIRQAYIGMDCNGQIVDSQIQPTSNGFQCNGNPCPYYERFECSGKGCSSLTNGNINYRCECPTWSTKYYLMENFGDINCIGNDKPNDQCTPGNFVKNTCHNKLDFHSNYDCFPSTTPKPTTTTKKPTPKPTYWAAPTIKPTPKPTYWKTTKKPSRYPTLKPIKPPTSKPTTTKKPTPKPTTWTKTPSKSTTEKPTGWTGHGYTQN